MSLPISRNTDQLHSCIEDHLVVVERDHTHHPHPGPRLSRRLLPSLELLSVCCSKNFEKSDKERHVIVKSFLTKEREKDKMATPAVHHKFLFLTFYSTVVIWWTSTKTTKSLPSKTFLKSLLCTSMSEKLDWSICPNRRMIAKSDQVVPLLYKIGIQR